MVCLPSTPILNEKSDHVVQNSCFRCISPSPKEQPLKTSMSQKSRSESLAAPSVERLDRNILLQQLRTVWGSDLNMARDLPRLSSRVVFRDVNPESSAVEVGFLNQLPWVAINLQVRKKLSLLMIRLRRLVSGVCLLLLLVLSL